MESRPSSCCFQTPGKKSSTLERYILRPDIRLRGQTVGHKPFANLGNQGLDIFMVQTEYVQTVERHLVDKIQKGLFDLFQVP